ncbi:MAG: winged helix-turn-helix domain-containing protein [Haloarculaceae archaeon]
MSQRALTHPGRPEAEPGPTRKSADLAPTTLLELLDDDYARGILEATTEEAAPARQLAERLDASRATVYRRLERLEEAGLVEPAMTYDADGYHRKVFRATLQSVTVTLDDGAVEATVDVADWR